jgi:hypothetical protein
MNPRPIPVTMHLLTIRGFVLQPELMTTLAGVSCAEGEYSLHLSETRTGIAAYLRCRNSIQLEERWTVEHDPKAGRFTYSTVFEAESVPQIVEAIRSVVAGPGVGKAA